MKLRGGLLLALFLLGCGSWLEGILAKLREQDSTGPETSNWEDLTLQLLGDLPSRPRGEDPRNQPGDQQPGLPHSEHRSDRKGDDEPGDHQGSLRRADAGGEPGAQDRLRPPGSPRESATVFTEGPR